MAWELHSQSTSKRTREETELYVKHPRDAGGYTVVEANHDITCTFAQKHIHTPGEKLILTSVPIHTSDHMPYTANTLAAHRWVYSHPHETLPGRSGWNTTLRSWT